MDTQGIIDVGVHTILSGHRDPRDIALSMWKSHFSGQALNYAYDWRWIAAKFNLYAASMRHWEHVFPDQILRVAYEDLLQDVTGEGERIADFCGLDWQPQMARPDQHAEQVLTLSATQLRQPVHAGSIGKWKAAQEQMAPFLAALDSRSWAGA